MCCIDAVVGYGGRGVDSSAAEWVTPYFFARCDFKGNDATVPVSGNHDALSINGGCDGCGVDSQVYLSATTWTGHPHGFSGVFVDAHIAMGWWFASPTAVAHADDDEVTIYDGCVQAAAVTGEAVEFFG